MPFSLSQRSLDNLHGVHPDLVSVVKEAIENSELDFAVIDGLRTLEEEKAMVAKGASTTLRSRHLTGHAVDIAIFIGRKLTWEPKFYKQISKTFKIAAQDLNVPIIFGGDWFTFKDYGHYELDRKYYP